MQRKEGVSRLWVRSDGPELSVPWSTGAVGKKISTRRARREANGCILIGARDVTSHDFLPFRKVFFSD